MRENQNNTIPLWSLHRLEALTDGVFAIVMTLLIFDIKVPLTSDPVGLWSGVVGLWPFGLSFLMSFTLLGIYWLGQRAQCHFIERGDHTLHWLALAFLACVSLLPFTTQLLARNPFSKTAHGFYAAHLSAIGLLLYAHWLHAERSGFLSEQVSPMLRCFARTRCLTPCVWYAASFLVSLASPGVGLFLFALMPPLYVVPAMQRRWLHLVYAWQCRIGRVAEINTRS